MKPNGHAMGEGDVMENPALTSNSVKARTPPRSVIIAAALQQETQDEAACNERILAEEYANATHSCFDEENMGADLFAEFTHSYY
jgi:hypothetical protein